MPQDDQVGPSAVNSSAMLHGAIIRFALEQDDGYFLIQLRLSRN
jgi:hypothetical protein